jgi:hypothetical protein
VSQENAPKWFQGRLDTPERRQKWSRKHVEKLEQKQAKAFNQSRQDAINRFREKSDMLALSGNTCPAVNHQPGNKNITEEAFAVRAVTEGWSVTKRGWPDYLCWRGDEVIFVEVKPDGQGLSTHQKLARISHEPIGKRPPFMA